MNVSCSMSEFLSNDNTYVTKVCPDFINDDPDTLGDGDFEGNEEEDEDESESECKSAVCVEYGSLAHR
jgi:hypothetical protein